MNDQMEIIADRWLMESRQLVNWGSYDGWHEFRPAADGPMPVTLLTGASESGKSTLVDAQISLLYPTGTPFNKASNAGRSERNDYTYLRGMLGVGGENDEPIYLRGRDGDGTPVAIWGAIVDTYRNRNGGGVLSCAKFLYLPAGERREQMRRLYLTWDKPIDPRLMDAHRGTAFTAAMLRDTYPGADTYSNAESFHARVWGTMGLNAEACRLLHRVQSADAPSRLDDIFKQGVLGVPAALDHARAAAEDWERYAGNFHDIERMEHRGELLRAIRDRHDAYRRALADLDAMAAADPDTDAGMAAIRRHADRWMADEVRASLPHDQARIADLDARLGTLDARVEELERDAADLDTRIRDNGGGNLDRWRERLDQTERGIHDAEQRRASMAQLFAKADQTMPADAEAWQAVREECAGFADEHGRRAAELAERRGTILAERKERREALAAAQDDLKRAERRRTRISSEMEQARALIARATGLAPEDLPYAAELMDVREDAEEWRVAMNVVYGSLARTILVDERHEQGFARAVSRIDREAMRRHTWRFVDTAREHPTHPAEGFLSSKLAYRDDSPFAGWLRAQTAAEGLDARCVEAIDDQDRGERQIQRDGQLKSADRGWHGTQGMRQVIGFADERYLDQLRHAVADATDAVSRCDAALAAVSAEDEMLRAKRTLADQLAYTPWEHVDVDGLRRQAADLTERIAMMEADPRLAELVGERERLRERTETARRELVRAEADHEQAQQAVAAAHAWLDAAQARLGADTESGADEAMELAGPVETALRDAYGTAFGVMADAEERAHAITGTQDAPQDGFAGQVREAMASRMRGQVAEARTRVQARRQDAESLMETYRTQYAGGDAVTAQADDYAFYEDELNEVSRLALTTSAGEEYANCLDKLLDDYVMLKGDVSNDKRTIGEQLDRINAVLRGKEFGPRGGELSIHATVADPGKAFMRVLQDAIARLNDWQQGPRDDRAAARKAFDACKPLTDALRRELADVQPNANGVRDYGARNLDPRCRSRFYATVRHADGRDERIDTTGGKSGGALQELTSFVYGAALIYVLGGGLASEPRYATLFLDEALIKADGRYTRRALTVLPNLGFQVIVSAPESKTAEIMEIAEKAYVARRDPGDDHTHLESMERADLEHVLAVAGDAAPGADGGKRVAPGRIMV
ncbi:hypothetical protein H7U32_03800 [Bifidobacterium pullorum subsp. saeculare]|uniref:P-loop containing region of AAA domain-containing protein n=1 Tax=Bifidobacterium pullorum subsp. saeculare TaxID=78257 RepID=A0A938WXH4_9BIFI|nr:ATP-binding protein [Bifidobacterium pullorum]MBM6699457.1 hypothetical protein [Bifidobacterium pullorum subsp. saeculare]